MGQEEYLTMMKNSSLERGSPVFEKNIYSIKGHK